MLIRVRGIKDNNTYYEAIVEGSGVHQVHEELVECMGIEAHSEKVFINELLDMGFDVYTKIDKSINIDSIPLVSIPINLNDNDNIF